MNSLLTAQYNTSRVLRQLWLNPGISRAEIADRLGLNRSTLTHIIKNLTDQGLVRVLDVGAAGPLGGRKNVRLAIDPSYGCFVGLDVQADMIRIVGVDVSGTVLFQKTLRLRSTGKRFYTSCAKAYDWVRDRLDELGVPLLGVGYGVAGIVDPDEQVIRQSIPLDMTDAEPIGARLADHVREPILVDNDANCCCWGEIVAKRDSASSSFLFVLGAWRTTLKPVRQDLTAIGVGIAIHDAVHRGKDYSAGEFRSIEWKPGRTSQFSLSDAEISAARTERRAFSKLTKELARNTALIVNVLDLDHLYLGGFFDADVPDVAKTFQQEIQRNWSYPNKPACEVRFSTHGELSVAYGAASMFLVRAFGQSEELVLTGHRAGITLLSRPRDRLAPP